jgi:glutamate racemase
MSDAPIGVVASGSGGLTVARMITARLPHEDVVALCDHAYAPWGRRPGRASCPMRPAVSSWESTRVGHTHPG